MNATVTQLLSEHAEQGAGNLCHQAAESAERAALVDRLNTLESALAALPDSPLLANARAGIQSDIQATKSQITATRPLSERLVLARQALGRAQQHQTTATELMKT
eukprot:2338827-Karenia_brevis.AAC.1